MKFNFVQELGKVGRVRFEGLVGFSFNEMIVGNEDFGEVLVRLWIVIQSLSIQFDYIVFVCMKCL